MRRVAVLGATGSVGRSAVDVLAGAPDRFRVTALTAHRNVAALAAQARALRPDLAVICEPALGPDLAAALAGTGIRTEAGPEAVAAAARMGELVVAGIVGAAGLAPTLAALEGGAVVAFANKECLVAAGPVLLRAAARGGGRLLPVDSEHSAIFQVFDAVRPESVRRLILTASGGPFRTWERAQMARATPQQAVAHPVWDMGAKISVDSATMMNKGLEIIEAHHLFGMDQAAIDVVVHPESIVHSLVEYVDGSVLAQLGTPDMRTPLAVALAWPERIPTGAPRLDLAACGRLTFEPPDLARFPALSLARAALVAGGGAPCVLSAANEVAVAAFLAGQLGFLDIVTVAEAVLASVPAPAPGSLDEVEALDQAARRAAEHEITRRRAAA